MRTVSTRLIPLVIGLALALTGAAPAAAQENPTSREAAFPLTEREEVLLSLVSSTCGSEIAFDSRPDNECPDALTVGKGVGCKKEMAQKGLLDALERNCQETCALTGCGARRKTQCGSFGHQYKPTDDDCEEVTASSCDDQKGFVCRAQAVTCVCICADA